MRTFILIHCDAPLSAEIVKTTREKIAGQLQDGLGVVLIPGGFRAEIVSLPPLDKDLYKSNT